MYGKAFLSSMHHCVVQRKVTDGAMWKCDMAYKDKVYGNKIMCNTSMLHYLCVKLTKSKEETQC